MATYKTFSLDLTTSAQDVGTVPASKVWNIAAIQVANVDGTNDVDVTVQWTDADNADKVTRLVYQATVASQDSLSPVVGSIRLQAGDKVQALASADGDAELTLSVIEGDA